MSTPPTDNNQYDFAFRGAGGNTIIRLGEDVIKHAVDNKRLKEQYTKIISLRQAGWESENCKLVNVNSWDESSGSYQMPYIYGMDILSYCTLRGPTDIQCLINHIIDTVISHCQNHSQPIKQNILNKLDGLQPKTNLSLKWIQDIVVKEPEIYIPVGLCHGDMTAVNMIIDNDSPKVTFIDSTLSYIESPLMDIIKFRQDTHFGWLFNQYMGPDVDVTKCKLAIIYIDQLVDYRIKQYNLMGYQYYPLLQAINLARIDPFITRTADKEWIQISMEKCKNLWKQH